MTRPTLHDVAAEAGVSIKTVSRVVNDAANVSSEVRERVERAIEELHYVPNTLARSLKAGRGDTIGVVIDAISDPFFASLTSAVEERALADGLGTVFGSTGFDVDRERAQVERMAMQRVRALILAPTQGPHDYLRRFETSFPMVMIDRKVAIDGYDTVRVDDVSLAHQAVAHLVAHGHRRIAFVGSDERFVTTRDRLTGFRKALAEAGVEPRESWIRPGSTDIDAEAVTTELLALTDPPTAVFAANPRAAVGVAHTLHTRDRADVAFVSFGDFPLARTLRPGVTVVDQSPVSIGLTAMDRVLARLTEEKRGEPADIVLDAALITRGSGEIVAPG